MEYSLLFNTLFKLKVAMISKVCTSELSLNLTLLDLNKQRYSEPTHKTTWVIVLRRSLRQTSKASRRTLRLLSMRWWISTFIDKDTSSIVRLHKTTWVIMLMRYLRQTYEASRRMLRSLIMRWISTLVDEEASSIVRLHISRYTTYENNLFI